MDTYYHIVPIAGKGLGCVALKDIQKGTIILQEKPQCAPEDCANLPEDARSIPSVLKAFQRVGGITVCSVLEPALEQTPAKNYYSRL